MLSPFRRARLWPALLVALLCGLPAAATTVVAPSFPELVAEARTIVRARVTAVAPFWAETPAGRVIKTRVTFAVEQHLKGLAAPVLTLDFLGGELDGQGMRVAGMPQFSVGATDILFVGPDGARFCPLIAVMHGRYRVLTDAATRRAYVARNDGTPLLSEHDVQLPQTASPVEARLKPASAALTPAAFEQRIVAELSRRAHLP